MLLGLWKKRKLAKEAKKQEEQRIQEEALQKAREEGDAYAANVQAFYEICNMVRSLPKERQIVVVQRRNIFKDKSDRNWFYKQLAREMCRNHRVSGQNWMSDYDDSLYAFYAPTKLTYEFRQALKEFSKDAYLIQHIRYYRSDY